MTIKNSGRYADIARKVRAQQPDADELVEALSGARAATEYLERLLERALGDSDPEGGSTDARLNTKRIYSKLNNPRR